MKWLFAKLFIIFLSFLFITSFDIYALEKDTHFELNGKVVDISGLDNYLKDTQIFLGGAGETINGYTIRDWIQLGGKYEDEPYYTRSFNHYHNPLSNTGYLGLFKSASQWAQDQGSFGSSFGGNYSWPAVRQYYHLGLTSSAKTDRDKNLADTFRGIGQLIHLVEDMSVPAHTRDDGHIFYNYEKYVLANPSVITGAAANPVYFGSAINGISSFFGTNQYTYNSGPDVTASTTIGLSEYTQANFFSEDTINDLAHFPYPKITDNMPIREKKPYEGASYQRQYYLKDCCGETNNGQGYLLAAVDYLDYYRQQYPSLSFALPKIPVLDDNVYGDYATLLLPRAVGYSAGLLNYFFRGQINMAPDQNSSGQYVIKNESNEYMSGLFSLYYDDTGDNRHHVASWSLSINANNPSSTVTFTPPTYPEPKQKGTYILAFQGTLGNENGAVAGRIVKLCGGETVTITISGSDAPQNGSQYTATGGTEPYTWSITKGSITQDGIVTVSGQCGTATITATDSCGNTETKDARMPGGFWLYTGSTTGFYGGVDGTYCQWGFSYMRVGAASSCDYGPNCCTYTITTATTKTVEAYRPALERDSGSGYPPCIVRADPDISNNSDTCGDLASFPFSGNGAFLAWKNHYVWNCP